MYLLVDYIWTDYNGSKTSLEVQHSIGNDLM